MPSYVFMGPIVPLVCITITLLLFSAIATAIMCITVLLIDCVFTILFFAALKMDLLADKSLDGMDVTANLIRSGVLSPPWPF